MKRLSLPAWTLAAWMLGGSVQAGSLAASSAAGGSSASVGSSASSEASSGASSASSRQTTAQGPYRITEVAALADRPGQVQLRLQALAADAPAPEHLLVLPQAIAAQLGLAVGHTVNARPQAYGTEFVHGTSQQAFYLVLTDGFRRELGAQPVRM